MTLKLYRYHGSKNDTLGLLFINDKFACYTVEDEYREDKVMHETRIPAGLYTVTLRDSPRFSQKYGHEMIAINNVPGFTGVLIHKGNTEKDTSGCIVVGNVTRFNPDGDSRVEESGLAYDRIYPVIAWGVKHEPVSIEVVDGDRM